MVRVVRVDRFHEKVCHWAEYKYNWSPYQYILWSPAIWHDLLFWKAAVCTNPSRGSFYTLQVLICKVFGVLGDIPKIVHIYETYLFNWWIDERSELPSIENAKRLHEWLKWRWLQHGWPSSLVSCDPSDTNDISDSPIWIDLRLSRMFCWFSSRYLR